MINLTQLTINNNPELRDLSPLLNLQHLSFFSVISCPALQHLPSLATLSNLTQIVFEDCAGITDLGQLGYQGPVSDAREEGGNNYLQNLHLLGCPGIKDLTPLRKFTNLKYINIWGCPGITKEMVDSLQMDMPDLQIIFDPSVYEKGKLIG
ncbi:MAG: hypothetical protein K2X98_04600 [Alphaproteobacteria bacterium]|nr:hypothetical protein [Alphaproteobacteria bacterium]